MNVRQPNRVTHTYTQRLCRPAASVFPLLCPVREADWIDGWHPLAVYSTSGVAEPDCVFVTDAEPHDAVWYITRHEPERSTATTSPDGPTISERSAAANPGPAPTSSTREPAPMPATRQQSSTAWRQTRCCKPSRVSSSSCVPRK